MARALTMALTMVLIAAWFLRETWTTREPVWGVWTGTAAIVALAFAASDLREAHRARRTR